MSSAAGPFTELLWAGPSVSYAGVNAASASAQFLLGGVSGAFEQPYIFPNFWQMGRRNQRARIDMAGVLNSTGGTATTAIFTVGLATASNTATFGTGGGALVATGPMTVTSFVANSGWRLSADIIARNVGYGTGGAVNTSLLTDAEVKCTQPGVAGGVFATGAPTLLSTIDAGAQWWIFATVTFSTSVTTNLCQVTRAELWGLN